MNLDLKKMAGGLILIIGLILFFSSLIDNNLNIALVSLASALILWVIYSFLLDVFDVRIFSWVISLSGFLVASSVLFMFGIEEVPYPVGAIIFHSEGFAGALGIALFSIFPILALHQIRTSNYLAQPKAKHEFPEKALEPEIMSDEWEIASDDDLQSDEFEVG